MSGGKWFNEAMQPKKITKLASYIVVDDDLVKKLVSNYDDIDVVRAHLSGHIMPGFEGAMSPLEAYDGVVRAVVDEILSQNPEIARQMREKQRDKSLGLEMPEVSTMAEPENVEEASDETGETVEDVQVRRADESRGDVFVPQKIEVFHKKTGTKTRRNKPIPWKKRGVTKLSSQEQYVISRRGEDTEVIKQGLIKTFKVHRSKTSILTKMRRLFRRISLTEKEERERKGGMTPQ